MKSLIFILSFLFCYASSFSQVITTNTPGGTSRSNKSVREVEDFNLGARTNFFVPRMTDTTQANTNNNNFDSCGRLVFTYDVDNVWIRRCTPSKHWEQLGTGSSSAILPQCGIANGTAIPTYDSNLVFDLTRAVYALCCDHVARVANDTVIVLAPANDTLSRIDAIVLGVNGYKIDTGVAAINPALPTLDSCETLVTFILINAGQTVPAFVNGNNPKNVYDQFLPNEWDSLKYVNTEADSANTQFPIHLTRALHVWNFAQDGSGLFEFHTDSTINLNDYGALKFYIRDSTPITLFITWYLDNVPQTASLQAPISPAVINGYQTIVIPITDWTFVGTSSQVNTIRFSIEPVPANSKGFFVDWIQLQSGIPAPASPLGVTFVNVGSLPPLFNGTVVNPTTNPLILFTQQTAAAYTVFQNDNNTAQFPSFGKLSLTNTVKDSLAISNIQGGPDGSYLNTNGGVKQWVVPSSDTILAGNFMVLRPVPNTNNDSLLFGYLKRDSSKLLFDTYASLNSHFLSFNQGATDLFKLSSNGTNGTATLGGSRFELTSGANIVAANNLTLGSDGNVFTVTGNTQINAITTANWQSGSNAQLIFTGTPTVKNNTAGGAGTAKILLAGGVDYTAAANDVLTLVYDGTNWHETARKSSGGAGLLTADNGLTANTSTNVRLGGTLAATTTINTNGNRLLFTGVSGAALSNSTVGFNMIGRWGGVPGNTTFAVQNSNSNLFQIDGVNTLSGIGIAMGDITSNQLDFISIDVNDQVSIHTVNGINYNANQPISGSSTDSVVTWKNSTGTIRMVDPSAIRGVQSVTTSSAGTLTISLSNVYVFNGTTSTWTLPVVSASSGRSYYIKNIGSGNVTLNSSGGGNDIYTTSAVNTITIGAGTSATLINNGTFFVKM